MDFSYSSSPQISLLPFTKTSYQGSWSKSLAWRPKAGFLFWVLGYQNFGDLWYRPYAIWIYILYNLMPSAPTDNYCSPYTIPLILREYFFSFALKASASLGMQALLKACSLHHRSCLCVYHQCSPFLPRGLMCYRRSYKFDQQPGQLINLSGSIFPTHRRRTSSLGARTLFLPKIR